jgi:uncharacterized repeat protein (TIGR01451 family)
MFFLRLKDTAAGTEVDVAYSSANGVDFVWSDPIAELAFGKVHTIKIWIKLHPGPNNDVVAVYVDGKDAGERFGTWEQCYRENPTECPGGVPAINSLMFRANVPSPGVVGGGYLFNHVTTSTGDGPGPEEPDVGVEKQASTRTVSPGGIVRYTVTARNRGRAIAHNVLVCDRIPREEAFVSADHELRQLGDRRCLAIQSLAPGQHMSFELTLRVSRNAGSGTIDNTTDETEGANQPPPPGPPPGEIPGHITDPKAKGEGSAKVQVTRARRLAPRRPAPRFTG